MRGNHQGVVQAPNSGLSAISTDHSGDGRSMESHSQLQKVRSGIGGVPGCSADERTTGAGFHYVSDQTTSKEKVSMVWVKTGLYRTMISNHIMIVSTS